MTTPANSDSQDAYKAALREFMAENGKPLRKRESAYDWEDYNAEAHTDRNYGEGCRWVVAPGSILTEDTFVEWGGTFGSDSTEMCVEVTNAACACGKYTDYTLRFVGSFGDVLKGALGATGTPGIPL